MEHDPKGRPKSRLQTYAGELLSTDGKEELQVLLQKIKIKGTPYIFSNTARGSK